MPEIAVILLETLPKLCHALAIEMIIFPLKLHILISSSSIPITRAHLINAGDLIKVMEMRYHATLAFLLHYAVGSIELAKIIYNVQEEMGLWPLKISLVAHARMVADSLISIQLLKNVAVHVEQAIKLMLLTVSLMIQI